VKWEGTDFKWGPGTTGPPAGDGPGSQSVERARAANGLDFGRAAEVERTGR